MSQEVLPIIGWGAVKSDISKVALVGLNINKKEEKGAKNVWKMWQIKINARYVLMTQYYVSIFREPASV